MTYGARGRRWRLWCTTTIANDSEGAIGEGKMGWQWPEGSPGGSGAGEDWGGGGTRVRACSSDGGSTTLGERRLEHQHGGGKGITPGGSGRPEGGRGGGAMAAKGKEEVTVAAACYGGTEAKLRWGIEGERLRMRCDTLGMKRLSPEREIVMEFTKPS